MEYQVWEPLISVDQHQRIVERLKAEVERLEWEVKGVAEWRDMYSSLKAENAKLREALKPKEGYQLVAVNDAFVALVMALERADRKGYLDDYLTESWEAFDYECVDAAAQEKQE
jgi:hypothetical protein